MAFASLSSGGVSHTVTLGEITFPRWGIWTARVQLDRGDAQVTGQVTITLGDQTFEGTVRRGTTFQGLSAYFIVGGADGWRKRIPDGSNQAPPTKLSRVIQDAALLVGEKVVLEDGADRTVGTYIRMEGPASRVLNQLAPKRWWVDADGVTHVGDRKTSISKPAILDYCPDEKRVRVAEEADFPEPGQTIEIDGVSRTIDTVVHCIAGAIRSELWLGLEDGGRLLSPLQSIVAETNPALRYFGCYEYSVSEISGTDHELTPTDRAVGVPPCHAKLRPGIPGLSQLMVVGAIVLVKFINGDPSRPFIAHVAGPDDAGFTPVSLSLDCSGVMSLGASSTALHLGGPDEISVGGETGRELRTGDTVILPISPGAVPTPYVLFLKPGTPMSTVQK